MSNVLERFREAHTFDILTDSRELRRRLFEWIYREKNVPKKKRVLFINDIKKHIDSIVNNARKAEYCYPKNEEYLKIRKDYILKAKESCTDLWLELQSLDDSMNFRLDLDKLEVSLNLLLKVNNSLDAWYKNNKIQKEDKNTSISKDFGI